jgi:hypothetical protein
MNKHTYILFLFFLVVRLFIPSIQVSAAQIEKEILKQITSKSFSGNPKDQRCHYQDKYLVYLIDNFEQPVELIPEITTTHGEVVQKILVSGRSDIIVKTLNTSLSKGLALVLEDLIQGECADAVISSIPGSNYSYSQINSFFPNEKTVREDNILNFQEELKRLLKRIAYKGFPSVTWLEQVDVNSSKLRNDAKMVAFADALGMYNIPFLIPYGNKDASYKNEVRSVNILSLVPNVRAYCASDKFGYKLSEYPHSPLSIGYGRAIYHVREIPDDQDPSLAHLDINEDGFIDYTFERKGGIAFRNAEGLLAFSPPLLSEIEFSRLKERIRNNNGHMPNDSIVLTADQYRELIKLGLEGYNLKLEKQYLWINSSYMEMPYQFTADSWIRGLLTGTSLIPPDKIKEILIPRSRILAFFPAPNNEF